MGRSASLVVLGFVGFVVLAGCGEDPVACAPSAAGLGDARRPIREALPGIDVKAACDVHVELVRTADAQRAAYAKLGIADVPAVDFATHTLVIREELDTHPVSWVVTKDATITIGSQACAGAASGVCSVAIFTVDAVVTKAEAYACEDIGCSSVSPGDGSGS